MCMQTAGDGAWRRRASTAPRLPAQPAVPTCPPARRRAQGRDLVPLYGVDQLVDMYGFAKVDVMKMDMEGAW